jgi:hypothetical protein
MLAEPPSTADAQRHVNMLWLAAFVLAGLGVYRRVQLAYLIVLFLALIGGWDAAPHIWS